MQPPSVSDFQAAFAEAVRGWFSGQWTFHGSGTRLVGSTAVPAQYGAKSIDTEQWFDRLVCEIRSQEHPNGGQVTDARVRLEWVGVWGGTWLDYATPDALKAGLGKLLNDPLKPRVALDVAGWTGEAAVAALLRYIVFRGGKTRWERDEGEFAVRMATFLRNMPVLECHAHLLHEGAKLMMCGPDGDFRHHVVLERVREADKAEAVGAEWGLRATRYDRDTSARDKLIAVLYERDRYKIGDVTASNSTDVVMVESTRYVDSWTLKDEGLGYDHERTRVRPSVLHWTSGLPLQGAAEGT